MKTSNLNLSLLYSHQAQKEITINEALIKIDALLNSGAKSNGINIPPIEPTSGDMYIVGTEPQGVWGNNPNEIAYYYFNQWYFVQPKVGNLMWVNDQEDIFYYKNDCWHPYKGLLRANGIESN